MINFLKKDQILTIINDYDYNQSRYDQSCHLPALPHAIVDCSSLNSIEDYIKMYKNMKRKIRVFKKKGGEFSRIECQLSSEQIAGLQRCFLSTAEKSVCHLPYQDLYLKAALISSGTQIEQVHYLEIQEKRGKP
ncbi:MAG: hypothetical protein HKN87_19235 [Saprospiraceae bacterium]|nr:hypothetical protein [Saprospiraceae bacterium]